MNKTRTWPYPKRNNQCLLCNATTGSLLAYPAIQERLRDELLEFVAVGEAPGFVAMGQAPELVFEVYALAHPSIAQVAWLVDGLP